MAYMEQLQSCFNSLVQAGEAGRHNIDTLCNQHSSHLNGTA